ncbi:MAG: sigma 54-interacting transcriptional regulator [Planctomycetota bacterium]
MNDRPTTLGALRESGWRPRTVREELRANLIAALRRDEPLFPGIVGYEDTVEPALVNALLAGHDLILLGLRGQAKTRLLRGLVRFLDPQLPALAGAPLNDDPFAPVSPEGRRILTESGDDAAIRWIPRDERYREKLATPDVSMADLIGDVDPIRASRRGFSIADEEAVAWGLLPRANRGIMAINELPDLSPRIQVALLNAMEERDVQVRGLPLRLELDLLLVFSANPEDYTKRGNLITPLRDRIAAQIHTHYPRDLAAGIAITRQEAELDRGEVDVLVPELAREVVEETARAARESDWIDQSSGVSARLTIALLETAVANAEQRALRLDRDRTTLRLGDLFASTAAIVGKVELVFEGEKEGPERVAEHIIGEAAKRVFDRRFPDFFRADEDEANPYEALTEFVRGGGVLHTDTRRDDEELRAELAAVPSLSSLVARFLPDLETGAAMFGIELLLEGLHRHAALAKDAGPDGIAFSDLVRGMWDGFERS